MAEAVHGDLGTDLADMEGSRHAGDTAAQRMVDGASCVEEADVNGLALLDEVAQLAAVAS